MTYIVSTVVASFAVVAFAFLLIPQIYENYTRRSTEGTSPSMIALWLLAGVGFVAYLHSVDANIALLVQWHVVNALCCVIAGQWFRYRNRRPLPIRGQPSNTPAPLRLSTPRLSASVTPTTYEKVILALPAKERARASTRAQALIRHSVSLQNAPSTSVMINNGAPTASAGTDGQPVTPRIGAGGAGGPTPMVAIVDQSMLDPAMARNTAMTVGGTMRPLPPIWHGFLFGLSWAGAYVVIFLAAWQIFEQCEGVSGLTWVPWVVGSIIPACGLAAGFVPQATLIVRLGSSEGFSRGISLLDFVGSGLSIIALAVDHDIHYYQMIPYLTVCGCQVMMLILTTCIYPPLKIINDLQSDDTPIQMSERVGVRGESKIAGASGGPVVSFFDSDGRPSSPAAADGPPSPSPSTDSSTATVGAQPIPEPIVPPEAASALLLSMEAIPEPHFEASGSTGSNNGGNVEPESVAISVA